jgi:hypothetical protein
MTEHRDQFDRAVELLKEPVELRADLEQRIMAEVASGPRPKVWTGRFWRAGNWVRRGRPVSVSPLGGLALAAGIVGVLFVGRALPRPEAPAPAPLAEAQGATVAQFVILQPTAASVSLVGDFNDWNSSSTPMRRAGSSGIWIVTVPLDPGRYRYAFLVDGATWVSDPSSPPALDDEFGPPSSVVTIGGS